MDLSARILIYERDGRSLRPIKIYTDESGKRWVEARNGTKFVIEVKNDSWNNILSVVSVDGLSVITGKRAKLEPKDGYIVSPYSSTKITGWRTSLENVREFVFTDNKKESYSHKLGADESNIGVIGFAFYKQKVIYNYTTSYTTDTLKWTIPPYTTSTSGTVKYSSPVVEVNSLGRGIECFSSAVDFSMGTKQGEKIEDSAVKVDMDFEGLPFVTDMIYYDSRENLIARGIIKEEKLGLPQPFENSGFCREV